MSAHRESKSWQSKLKRSLLITHPKMQRVVLQGWGLGFFVNLNDGGLRLVTSKTIRLHRCNFLFRFHFPPSLP